ncbi:MAG: MBL fold metallo-hydrolase [Gemmatimonadota bacterium]
MESESGTRLLLDTPPELRLQLIAAGIDSLDAIFFTHDHADHIHGIDDVRAITLRQKSPLPMLGPAATLKRLSERFPYIFDETMLPLPGTSKPEGIARRLDDGERVRIGDIDVEALAVPHGLVTVFGYRIGDLAYVTDAKTVPADVVDRLRGVRVLILNALFHRQHPTHLSISEAIEVSREVGAERTYLTHLTHENFHADLEAELPRGVTPAFDGLVVRV